MQVRKLKSHLSRLLPWSHGSCELKAVAVSTDDPPLRVGLLNLEQLDRHARVIAGTHRLATGPADDKLLPRLAENERILIATYDLIAAATAKELRIAPAAEWLLDNFYLIEEQIRSTRRLLPRSYSSELPRIASGRERLSRAYAVALELISHTDGRIDSATLNAFLTAYQSVVPLKLGELWAIPLMLRLALIENLRRVAVRIAKGRCDRDQANHWAEKMTQAVEEKPTNLVVVLAEMAKEDLPLSGAFLAELTQHLQGQPPIYSFANNWLEQRLNDHGQNRELLIQAEGQAQASDQVSVGNSITSLRFLAVYDWRRFVSDQSLVEQTLCRDPAGVYGSMDFATRDRYRHAVEAVARRSKSSEYEVAERAVQLARAEASVRSPDRMQHVGYFLIDDGRAALERFVGMHVTPAVAVEKFRRRNPLFLYGAAVLLVTAAVLATLQFSAERVTGAMAVLDAGGPCAHGILSSRNRHCALVADCSDESTAPAKNGISNRYSARTPNIGRRSGNDHEHCSN